MRTVLVVVAAVAIVLVGATAVLAAPAGPSGRTIVASAFDGLGGILSDVLDELVGERTITREQADAIEQRVREKAEARREELRAEREQRRTEMAARREAWKKALEDGKITKEELDTLVPEDHPLRRLDEFLDDGELSAEELQQLRGLRPFGGRGHGHGFFGLHQGADPKASPSPSGTES